MSGLVDVALIGFGYGRRTDAPCKLEKADWPDWPWPRR